MKDGEIKKYIKKVQDDSDKKVGKLMNRYMGAYKEEMHDYVKAVAEQHMDLKKTLDEHTVKIDNLTMDMIEVKRDIKEVKFHVVAGLKEKVDKKHFVDLEGRVRVLEKV